MPDATITSTASTFGTITGTFAADQSTVTGTITGIITGTLSGSVGVPGQQGPVGPQGPQGEPGEGVPVGGTAGQFLTKIDGTNYNTDWTTLNLSAYLTKAGNLEGLTNLVTARDNLGLGTTSDPVFNTVQTESDIYVGRGVPGAGIIFGDDTQQNTAFPGFAGYATESWVTTGFAPKASPAFTGNPTAPTPTLSDNDTSIATTAFVKGQGYLTSASLSGYATESWVTAGFAPIAAGLPSNGAEGQILVKQSATAYDAEWQDNFATELRMPARNETGSTLTKGTVVYISGGAGNKPLLSKALATSDATSAQTMGIVTADISNNHNGDVTIRGQLKGLDTSAFAVGTQLYLSGTTAGTYTSTKPSAPTHLVYVGIVVRSNSTEGAIEVAVQNGYELDELHDVALSSEANNDLLAYESSTNLWKNKTFSALGLLTSATAASTYAPIASPTFTGTVTIPAGASITGYLTTTDAASTYQTIAGMSSYLTTSAAASTYYPLSGNPSGFLTSSSLTGYATESWVTTALGSYLTTSAASATYLTQANAATSYYPLSSNPAGYLTSAPVTSVAGRTGAITLSNTDISGLGTLATVNDAPSDGSQYARKNGAWDVVTGGGSSYITSVSSPLAVSSGNLTVDLSAYAPLASPALSGTPTAPTASLGTNTTQIATTAFVIANAGGGGGGVDVQTFGDATTSGTFTNGWTKPAGAKYVEVWLFGGGGGGQSGARQATSVARSGGGGAAGGTLCYAIIEAASLGSTETVVVGAGGAGGASRTTDSSAGATGSDGGNTTFSNMIARGGNRGANAGGSNGGQGKTSHYYFTNVTSGAGAAGATGFGGNGGTVTTVRVFPMGGGGGAGAAAASTTNNTGGVGATFISNINAAGISVSVAGGSGGTAAGVPATAGTSASNQFSQAGTGGGGGYYRTAEAGNTGGAGGWPGGGGGGGGASDNGYASGAGGNGANGYAVIITHLE
jgi:hypothetical protein